ncbi:MAG: siderophore-interacting protein [Pseudomonadota bacterium]
MRIVEVESVSVLSPNMRRIELAGASLSDFPAGYEGGYVKLVFPQPGKKALNRSYTIRHFQQEPPRLSLDIVVHGESNGPGAEWSRSAKPGDRISIGGPGSCKRLSPEASWYILAGDMSAMPAILVNLAALPADAVGHVVLEIINEADKIAFDKPGGMQLHWVVNPNPTEKNTLLADTVKGLPWRDEPVGVWVAGEFASSRALREYFRHERNVGRDAMYLSCYWKIGTTDEGMKAAKRADAEAW